MQLFLVRSSLCLLMKGCRALNQELSWNHQDLALDKTKYLLHKQNEMRISFLMDKVSNLTLHEIFNKEHTANSTARNNAKSSQLVLRAIKSHTL